MKGSDVMNNPLENEMKYLYQVAADNCPHRDNPNMFSCYDCDKPCEMVRCLDAIDIRIGYLEQTREVSLIYEQKLEKLMGHDAFYIWSIKIAKDMFLKNLNTIQDEEFKKEVLDNLPLIFGRKEGEQ